MSEEVLKIWAPLAVAATSLIVATISFFSTRLNQRDLQKLQNASADRSALRDYQYEALKRLYLEFEPIKFHLLESCEDARKLILDIAKDKRSSDRSILEPSGGNYARYSRIYNLLRPAAYFRLLRHRLTLVDFEVNQAVALQYQVAKQFAEMLSRDHDVARACALTYTPYVKGWRQKRIDEPAKFRRQGLPPGRLENALVALFGEDVNRAAIVKGFGEFELDMEKVEPEDVSSALGAASDLFAGLDGSCPVLWRILIVQFILYELFEAAVRKKPVTMDELVGELPSIRKRAMELDLGGGEAADSVAFVAEHIFPASADGLAAF